MLLLADVDNIGDVTVTNLEIKHTIPDVAEPEEGHRTPTHDDDIDQAFAMYEKDHSHPPPLKEQLNVISMVNVLVRNEVFTRFWASICISTPFLGLHGDLSRF